MTIQEAINFVDIARMNYICDPKECGLEKGEDPCTAFHCDEMHDALVMAIEALQIADRLEIITENSTNRIEEVLCADCESHHICMGWCGEKVFMIKGYNQALDDIRGNAE